MMFFQRRVEKSFNLRAGQAGLRIPTVEKYISLLKDVRTFCGSQPASYTEGAGSKAIGA